MGAFRTLSMGLLFSTLPMGLAFAQADQPESRDSSLSTHETRDTTVIGQTKPPSHRGDRTLVMSIDRPTPRRPAGDAIVRRICNGCASGPGATGPQSIGTPNVAARDTHDRHSYERAKHTEVKQQADLDTVTLASAHRERAKSMEEKTNGLWQSWLVSVCDGCGDQKPAKLFGLRDWIAPDAPTTTSTVGQKPSQDKAQLDVAKQPEVRSHGSLAADLSPGSINSIRRMPQQ